MMILSPSRKARKGKGRLMAENEIGKWIIDVAVQIHREED
jgi:hypothetical protein